MRGQGPDRDPAPRKWSRPRALGRSFWCRRGDVAAHQALVGQRLQLAGEAADEAAHRARQAGERGSDHADEAPVEDLAGRQLGDRVDLLGGQHVAVHPAALEGEQARGAAEVRERLGGLRGVAVDEHERGRALQELLERLGARVVGRTLGQRVLDDAEAGVDLAQLGAQLGGLGHGRAAVVHRVHGLRFAELDGHLFDDRGFLVSVQTAPPVPDLRVLPEVYGEAESGLRGCFSLRSARVRDGSTLMPGPCVEAMTMVRRYLPLAADGLARMSSSITAW